MAKNKSTLPTGTMKLQGTIAGKPYPERILRQRVIHDHWAQMGRERWEGVSAKEKTAISRKGAMSRAAAARELKAEKTKAKPKSKPKAQPAAPAKKAPARRALSPLERQIDEATGYDQSPDYEESAPVEPREQWPKEQQDDA